MCGRYTLEGNEEDFGRRYDVTGLEKLLGRNDVKPTTQVPIITGSGEQRHAESARWGLVPHWAKHQPNKFTMINAKSEELLEKKTYAPLVKTAEKRCLLPADGFYEWMKAEDPKQKKQRMLFSLPDRKAFAFAGLFEHWEYPEFGEMTSCTLMTTSPNREVAPVHGRMPVIFTDPAVEDAWLDPKIGADEAIALLGPLPNGLLQVEAVNI